LHRARNLADEDSAIRDSIPVTALPRTLLDLGAELDQERLGQVIERAERLGLFDLRPVESLLSRAGGHRGAGRLRRALALYQDDPAFVRSRLERRFLDLVRASDLPPPSTNLFIGEFELDVYWPEERFAVELDSFEFHGTREAFEDDRRRQEELKLAGIEMLRVTWRRLDEDPEGLVERIGTLLERRRRQ
jgi:very-short-patch-repair endonuclease